MAVLFFDTSALVKYYHPEMGSDRVTQLIDSGENRIVISRFALVELHSALAKKARSGVLTNAECRVMMRRFRGDLRRKKYGIIRLLISHFRTAIQIIQQQGLKNNIRTLDSLQLASAVHSANPHRPIQFVSSDDALCQMAQIEGLLVLNPVSVPL